MHDIALHELVEDYEEDGELKKNGVPNGHHRMAHDEESGLGMRIPSNQSVPRLSGSGRARVERDQQLRMQNSASAEEKM